MVSTVLSECVCPGVQSDGPTKAGETWMNVKMNLFMKGDLLNVTNEPQPIWLVLEPQLHIIVDLCAMGVHKA